MSLPAPRRDEELPPDLADLAARYRKLPHQSVRYDTDIGDAFKADLERAYGHYSIRELAEALHVTPQGVSYILNRRRALKARRWPQAEDLRQLHAAWRVAQARNASGQPVGRATEEYFAVHVALDDLLERDFQLQEIALALGVTTRRLNRFVYVPLLPPDQLSEAVRKIVERTGEPGEPAS